MSALARYFKAKGCNVSGYDRTPSELTERLQSEGIEVHYEDDIKYIPKDIEDTLVIWTPAIPQDMGELCYVKEHGYRLVKRSRALGETSRGMRCLAVAGTHGKTTTSTLLGHIFQDSGCGCNAFLGGISKNYDTNLLLADNKVFVAEADEFDRSFLQLFPEIAVITAMDADHLDIYDNISKVHEAFRSFAAQVSGTLIAKLGLPVSETDTKAKLLHYSLEDNRADFYASKLNCDEKGHYIFELHYPGGSIEGIRCGIPGRVNVENSIAAAAAALSRPGPDRGEALLLRPAGWLLPVRLGDQGTAGLRGGGTGGGSEGCAGADAPRPGPDAGVRGVPGGGGTGAGLVRGL